MFCFWNRVSFFKLQFLERFSVGCCSKRAVFLPSIFPVYIDLFVPSLSWQTGCVDFIHHLNNGVQKGVFRTWAALLSPLGERLEAAAAHPAEEEEEVIIILPPAAHAGEDGEGQFLLSSSSVLLLLCFVSGTLLLLLLLLLPVVLLLPLAFDLRGGANGQQFSGQFSTSFLRCPGIVSRACLVAK